MVQRTTLRVSGMSCGRCVGHVTQALMSTNGVVSADVDLGSAQAVVEHLPEWADAAALTAAVEQSGYQAEVIRGDVYTGGDGPSTCGCCCTR